MVNQGRSNSQASPEQVPMPKGCFPFPFQILFSKENFIIHSDFFFPSSSNFLNHIYINFAATTTLVQLQHYKYTYYELLFTDHKSEHFMHTRQQACFSRFLRLAFDWRPWIASSLSVCIQCVFQGRGGGPVFRGTSRRRLSAQTDFKKPLLG